MIFETATDDAMQSRTLAEIVGPRLHDLAFAVGLQASPRAALRQIEENDAVETQRFAHAADDDREDVVDRQARIDRRENLLKDQQLGVFGRELVSLRLDLTKPLLEFFYSGLQRVVRHD